MPTRMIRPSPGLANVRYEIRGRLARRAHEMERLGHDIVSLNIGNPGAFGFRTPETMRLAMIENLRLAEGYSHQKGIFPAREAVVMQQQERGVRGVTADDVFIGNGVSELIDLTLRALLAADEEVLVPSPDYPLWTAAVNLNRGRAVHYPCRPERGFIPNPEEIEALITKRTRAIVVINPNNPTGAVYSREILQGIADIARENSLLVLSDEIYDRILFDGAEHIPMAAVAPDLLVLTFNGLSKTYRVAGYRSGWLVITGPKGHARGFLEGITLLASTRLCPNVPAQHAVQAALSGVQSIDALIGPSGRLHEQRDAAWESLEAIPGVSCVKPEGALYAFPRFDPEVHEIRDDAKFVYDFLVAEHVLLVQGTGFNWPTPDHVRIVTLPEARVLSEAIERLGNFLSSYRQ